MDYQVVNQLVGLWYHASTMMSQWNYSGLRCQNLEIDGSDKKARPCYWCCCVGRETERDNLMAEHSSHGPSIDREVNDNDFPGCCYKGWLASIYTCISQDIQRISRARDECVLIIEGGHDYRDISWSFRPFVIIVKTPVHWTRMQESHNLFIIDGIQERIISHTPQTPRKQTIMPAARPATKHLRYSSALLLRIACPGFKTCLLYVGLSETGGLWRTMLLCKFTLISFWLGWVR